jgi:hypothetical protein
MARDWAAVVRREVAVSFDLVDGSEGLEVLGWRNDDLLLMWREIFRPYGAW